MSRLHRSPSATVLERSGAGPAPRNPEPLAPAESERLEEPFADLSRLRGSWVVDESGRLHMRWDIAS